MNLDQIIIWLIVGALAGSLAGWLVRGSRKGYGVTGNIVLGLVGAVIGGALFDLLKIDLGLGRLTINGEDLAAAFIGSLILLGIISYLRKS